MSETRLRVGAVAMAALLLLAGCAGSTGPGTGDETTPDSGTASLSSGSGTIQFYISDEKNAINDFEHLNVTITKIGLHRVGDEDDADEDDDENVTTTVTKTATETPTPTTTETAETEKQEEETEEADADEEDADDDGEWVEYEVNATVDLTELQGANATTLGALKAPNGTYDKVFVYVDGINATLKNGEQVNVKLPSNKLQLNKRFTIGNNETVKFVYDLSVFKAGNSGKYILKPVVSQSGTGDEVDIRDVDEDEDEENETDENEAAETETDEEETETASDLAVAFQGPIRAGEQVTLKVTDDAGPVANATVTVNGDRVGTTDADGTLQITVPEDAEELEVTVTKGDAETEVSRDVGGGYSLRGTVAG